MKKYTLLLLAIVSAGVAYPVSAEDNVQKVQAQKQTRGHQPAPPPHVRVAPQANRNFSNPAARAQYQAQHPRSNYNPDYARMRNRNFTPRVTSPPAINPAVTNPPVTTEAVPPANTGLVDATNSTRTRRNGGGQNWQNGNGGNWRNGNSSDYWRKHQGQGGQVNRSDWSHTRWSHWDRSHRDRTWWTSHYQRFARFGGGYYYWDAGYWFPAYGYDSYFSTYSYDAPIYGYNDLEPAQVIANVQAELQRAGYYQGELDGQFGAMTRRALLDFQRDNGLPVTGEIDEDTLSALSLQ
jgi:hypothetical protein